MRIEKTTAVILAAGASTRMGRPKALLEFDGKKCLEVVVSTAAAAGCPGVIVVLGKDAGEVLAGCRLDRSARVVINEQPERGQTSSLKKALSIFPSAHEGFFVQPVDHPLVEASDYIALAAAAPEDPPEAAIAIPTYAERKGHPVLLGASHRDMILFLGDDSPLHEFIRARSDFAELVPVNHSGVVAGMNTEEEYRAVLSEYRRRRTETTPH